MIINGIELNDVDFTEADIVDAYEDGLDRYMEFAKNNRADDMGVGNYIRGTCEIIRDWADGIFGIGAGSSCIPNDSLNAATLTAKDIVMAYSEAMDNYVKVAEEITESEKKLKSRNANRKQRQDRARNERRNKNNGGKNASYHPK